MRRRGVDGQARESAVGILCLGLGVYVSRFRSLNLDDQSSFGLWVGTPDSCLLSKFQQLKCRTELTSGKDLLADFGTNENELQKNQCKWDMVKQVSSR